ncbi:protein LURP-one-related 15 [Tanacetum coccineum]
MAAQISYTPTQMSNSDTIVTPQFLAPYPGDQTITRKVMSLSLGNAVVTDVNGNVVESTGVVAQMHKKYAVHHVAIGKDTFDVTVNLNVDHAFIVTLIVILYEINEEQDATM